MSRDGVQFGLVLASLAAIGAGAGVARVSLLHPLQQSAFALVQHASSVLHPPSDSGFRLVIQTAPFRVQRVRSAVRYDPARIGEAAPPPASKAPKPALVLSGIVWGEQPVAALEGIPGVEGARLLTKGDTIGGLRIRRIDRSRVVVAGFDTTWVLTVREAWP